MHSRGAGASRRTTGDMIVIVKSAQVNRPGGMSPGRLTICLRLKIYISNGQ